MPTKILLVDDDPQALESTRKILEFAGFTVECASDGQHALEKVQPSVRGKNDHDFDLVITDVRMPRLGGLEFLRALSLCGSSVPVILMTAYGRVEDAVWAMKLGAVDFLTKPFKRQALLAAVESVLRRKTNRMSSPLTPTGPLHSMKEMEQRLIGSSSEMQALRALLQRVAPTSTTLLLHGESGTGKELVARCLHDASGRSQEPFIALNCAAVPEQLIESELFGYDKGAFTGATGTKEGLFEAAHRGTLLLDEIGDMPLPLQTRLLRTLQEGEVRRLGSTQNHKVDVRVIAASHQDLSEKVRNGTFRQDLLYRLEVIHIHIPALRERLVDIPELVKHFLSEAALRHSKTPPVVTEEAMAALQRHAWPGNIRELSNVMERAVVLAEGEQIELRDLPEHFQKKSLGSDTKGGKIEIPFGSSLKDVEDLLIQRTLEATDGDKNMTAKILGITERTIYRRMDKKPSLGKD